MLRKARLYRFFALVFAALGLLVFMLLYFRHVEGSFFSAMTNPFVVTIILVPFLPSIALSWRARKYEKKFAALTEKMATPADQPKSETRAEERQAS